MCAKVKKNILLFEPIHRVNDSALPLIDMLHNDFTVTLLLLSVKPKNHHSVKKIFSGLELLIANKILKKFYFLYDAGSMSSRFKQYKLLLSELRRSHYQYWITPTLSQPFTLLVDKALPKCSCKRIIAWPAISFLLFNPKYIEKYCSKGLYRLSTPRISRKYRLESSVFIAPLVKIIRPHFSKLYRGILILYKLPADYWNRLLLRAIFPIFYFHTILFVGKKGMVTQMSSHARYPILFTDPMEVLIHRQFYNSNNVHLMSHPGEGFCRCTISEGDQSQSDKIILFVCAMLAVDIVSDEVIDEHVKCLNFLKKSSSVNAFHLRPHPRETGSWCQYLCDELLKRGFNVQVKSMDDPLHKVVCGYIGVAGHMSGSLREARAFCDRVFIVAFERLSALRFKYPRVACGEGEGIHWVDSYTIDSNLQLREWEYSKVNRPSLLDYLKDERLLTDGI